MTDLKSFTTTLRQFVSERDWGQFHDPKNLAMLLASEVGELVAEYRWVTGAAADEHSRAAGPRARIAAEIGDAGIALLLLCERTGIDLVQAMSEKLERNAGAIRSISRAASPTGPGSDARVSFRARRLPRRFP
jgi:dCTP diphosphatase